jgi:hypothetical protein
VVTKAHEMGMGRPIVIRETHFLGVDKYVRGSQRIREDNSSVVGRRLAHIQTEHWRMVYIEEVGSHTVRGNRRR